MSNPLKKYSVMPATGLKNQPKLDRWNVVVDATREVMRGPYTSEALAQLICDAMNDADVDARITRSLENARKSLRKSKKP